MNTKCLVLIAIAIAWVPMNVASAQDSTGSDSTDYLVGPWALQFRVTQNFTLSALQGSVVSAQYSLHERDAIRLGLSVGGGRSNSDGGSATDGDVSFPRSSGFSEVSSSISLGVDAQYLFFSGPARLTRFFWGVGPSVGFSQADSESDNSSTAGLAENRTHIERETNSWNAGAAGVAGVEWFASQRISFLAEYFFDFSYQRSNRDDRIVTVRSDDSAITEDSITEESSSSGWSFGGRFVRFGLTVYL